ncbi:MAG TPA: hypothetical protein VKM55_18540 [Candidatus Lokiarchaeia archaeon]|nr:hypothetical protein [Candidatus Lokiarchaeia archaeon]
MVVLVGNKVITLWALDYDWNFFLDQARILLTNPAFLYANTGNIVENLLNLPAYLLYISLWYIPVQTLGLTALQSLFAYDFSNVLWNVADCFLIYKIIRSDKLHSMLGNSVLSNPYILMSLYMGTSLFYFDYFVGQDNALVGFFLLLGIIYYLNDKQHYTYFFWGIGWWFKPNVGIFILVLILSGPLKRFVKNAAFFALSQIPNILIFMLYPILVHDFTHNILLRLGSQAIYSEPYNLIQFLYVPPFNLDLTTSYIIVYCSLLPLTAYAFMTCKKSLNLFDQMMILALLATNLIQGTPEQLIFSLGLYLVWISTSNPIYNDSNRYLKVMLGLPYLSGFLWLVFPYFAIMFFSGLIWLDLLIIFSKKPSNQDNVAHVSTREPGSRLIHGEQVQFLPF